MQSMYNFHTYMLVISEHVTSLKKRLRYRSYPVTFNMERTIISCFYWIFDDICFTKYLLSKVSFLVYSDLRSSSSGMFFKIVVLKTFQIFTGKHLPWSLFLLKLFMSFFFNNFIKAWVLSCEYCKMLEMFKNNFIYRTPMMVCKHFIYKC